MKKFLFTLTLVGALALGGPAAFAQAKKKTPGTGDSAEKAKTAESGKPKTEGDSAKPKAEGDAKAIPMYVHADEINVSAKTITQVTKEGKKSTNTVTATTVIMNGDKPAKLEDIKKGDYVSGNRKKTGESTYDIIKITKFGLKAAKPEGEGIKPEAGMKKPGAEKK